MMKQKLDSIQVIRALAFLGIFASHSGITIFSSGGPWGVSVFFVLSGFLMTYSYFGTDRITSNSLKYSFHFGIKKIKKLYPLHIATMLLAIPILVYDYMHHSGFGKIIKPAAKIITNGALIQSWIPKMGFYFSLNGVSWYLSVSFFLYMMFPLILLRMKKYKGGIRTAIIVIVVTFALQAVMAYLSYVAQVKLIHDEDFIHWFVYIFPLSRLEDFIIGCNLGYIYINSKRDKESNSKICTLSEIGVVGVIIILWIIYVTKVTIPSRFDSSVSANNWWRLTVLWTISSCALIYLFALNRGKLSKVLSNKAFIFIGNMSANGFLIHQMVYKYLDSFERMLFGQPNKYISLFVCFAITMASAFLWERIEKKKQLKKLDTNAG